MVHWGFYFIFLWIPSFFAGSSWMSETSDTQELKETEEKAACYLALVWFAHPTLSATHDLFPRSPFSCVLPTVSTWQHSQQKLYGIYCFVNPLTKPLSIDNMLKLTLTYKRWTIVYRSLMWLYQREFSSNFILHKMEDGNGEERDKGTIFHLSSSLRCNWSSWKMYVNHR